MQVSMFLLISMMHKERQHKILEQLQDLSLNEISMTLLQQPLPTV